MTRADFNTLFQKWERRAITSMWRELHHDGDLSARETADDVRAMQRVERKLAELSVVSSAALVPEILGEAREIFQKEFSE